MLEARGIASFPDKLHAEVEGDIEDVDGTIVVSKIRVKYHIRIPKGKKQAAERALSFHQDKCPAAVSVKRGIEVTWSAEIEEE
ncbi:MAG: OsmC family protein [bacterium]